MMEEVLCNKHGRVCMLKTGTKDGPSKGQSFYICISQGGCGFTQKASVRPSHCINHEDSMVELQAITRDLREQKHRLYYRCVVGKAAGQKWCGNVPWTPPEKENQNPLSDRPPQPSLLPPVRNPFKAPEKTDHQDSEWKKMTTAPGETEKKASAPTSDSDRLTASQENGSKGSNGKEDARSKGVEDEDGGGRSNSSSDSYRGRHLPPGMKVKKRVSNEERSVSTSDGEKNVVAEVKEKARETCHETIVEIYRTSSVKSPPHTDEACKIPPKPDGAAPSTQQPTGAAIKTAETQEEASRKTKESASDSSPVVITQAGPKKGTSTSPHATHSKEHQDESRSDSASALVDDDDDDDDLVFVSVKPATPKTPPVTVTSVQKTLTAFSGFRQSSLVGGQREDPRELHNLLSAQLKQKKATLSVVNVSALPDKGERLKNQVKDLEDALESLSITAASQPESSSADGGGSDHRHAKPAPPPPCQSTHNPFSRQGGTVLLPRPPAPGPLHLEASGGSSQGYSHFGAHSESAFYGGRMTDNRLLAVKNATSEAIDHLHTSMESCPGPDDEVSDPKGIKVTLLAHQRKALAWLLWRENQKPCGGILADDMGLGKTLTIIALILAQKKKTKEEDHKDGDKQLDSWISKNDSGLVVSEGTLIICPASLIHHWKNEIDRHVKTGKLSVYLYHGANRQRNARVLANHDVVVTTYSLVSKEIPVQKDDAEQPSTDSDRVPPNSAPLLRVAWARVVLDEAHNIKNPKVQQSQAACRLRAQARWAVTGTPIQNNLLDMYSLLKFLRCSPFDEYKLWKSQVDNGSKRGGERLNLLTKSLLLRRTKDQRDSLGKPLVYLPDRTCEVHRVKLSEEELAVYNVVFAQSRSTLQNYLKRHEGNDVSTANASTSNPFDKVAQEFGLSQSEAAVASSSSLSSSSSQKAGTTGVHILSLLLRLRQCCCHLSLLKKTLDQTELQGDGIILSLEEQLNALCLSSSPSPSAPDQDTVSLNGNHFPSQLFESTSESTKISAVMTELKAIKQKGDDQKSVIVSQWTSMLRIVAVHLQKLGLTYGVIDGSVIPKKRMDLVEEFNTNPKGPQVMLVSLCAGGVGLNLIGGNHLFLVDMHWNPALEDQACDRIYRVGQVKDVTIHRFVCEGTVEDKISVLQAKKKELAQKVLSGTGSSVTKLSLADLRVIFGI